MLTQFVVRYDEDKTTRIPLGGLWTIARFADLQRGKLERELMRKSRWNVRWRLGGLVLGIAVVITALAALASVTETWEERVLRDGHTAAVRRAVFSPESKHLVTGEDGGTVQLWTAAPLRPTSVLGKHDARIKSVAFSPDGTQVVSAGDDKMIALWDVSSRRLVTRIGLHISPLYTVAFSPDGQQLVSGEHDHSVRLYTRRRSLWGWSLD